VLCELYKHTRSRFALDHILASLAHIAQVLQTTLAKLPNRGTDTTPLAHALRSTPSSDLFDSLKDMQTLHV
jgi:hypothetical protein